MSISKVIIADKEVYRIKFRVTDSLVDRPKQAALLGDFNNWDPLKGQMKKSEDGFFEKTIELPFGGDYQCRYLIDNYSWENDWQADAYVPSPYSEDSNMILSCIEPEPN